VGQSIIITIDGPAGAGKSTLGRRLAQALGYRYVDSGALYRAVAWQARETGLDPADSAAVARLLAHFQPHIASDAQGFHLSVDGRERFPGGGTAPSAPVGQRHFTVFSSGRRGGGRGSGPGKRGLS